MSFGAKKIRFLVDFSFVSRYFGLRTFAQKFSNIDFFLKILPLKDDDLVMSEM